MKCKKFFQKLVVFIITAVIGISSLSYACGMGSKAPSGDSGSASSEEGNVK